MTHSLPENSPDRLERPSHASANAQLVERPRFRADIEGLRAIAILLVVAYHAGIPGFSGGYIGVDVFFVISGYLITWLLVYEAETKGRVDLVRFYAKRAKRLFPALALMLLAVCGLSLLIYSPTERGPVLQTALAAATFRSNLFFSQTALDYLGTDLETNPLLHAWSLNVEEQFYFVWPLLIALLLGCLQKWGLRSRRTFLLSLLSLLSVVSFAYAVHLTTVRQPSAFFLSPPRAWEFIAGAIAVLIPVKPHPRTQEILGWLGLSGLLCASYFFNALTPFPGTAALLPTVATVFLLRSGQAQTTLSKIFARSPFQTLGKLSYSWYLWHWPLLILGGTFVDSAPLWFRICLVAIALILAIASYHWVENPIRRSAWLPQKSAYPIAIAIITAVVLSITLSPATNNEVDFVRSDGGPPMSLFQPYAKIAYSFSDPGTVNVVKMDEEGFCNPPGLYRQTERFDILVVGDSFTWCTTVAPEDAWVAQLAALTSQTTYNLSKPGIGPYEYLELLKHFGLPKSPKRVVMSLYEGNDLRDALAYKAYTDPKYAQAQPDRPGLEENFRYRFIFDANTIPFNLENADSDEVFYARQLAANRVSPSVFSDALREFVDLSKTYQFMPLLTYTPSAYTAYQAAVEFEQPALAEIMSNYSQKQRAFLAEQAKQLGLDFVDFTPALQAAAQYNTTPENLLYYPTNRHLTRYGHAVVAKDLAAMLGSKSLD